ncbi:MAG: hypothetical protein ACJ8DC_10290 [Gemmatimonadales bacterium]
MRRSLPVSCLPFVLSALGAAALGCSADSATVPAPPPGASASTVRVQITQASATTGLSARLGRLSPSIVSVASGVGEAAPEHLEYFLTSLRLCESVETNGTAFNNTQGCVEIYSNQTVDYETYGYAEARADATAGNYFDLMDPATLTALNQSVPVQAGSYQWALATWNRPVRVQASIPLSGGGSLFTQDGDPSSPTGYSFTRTTADLTTGPSALAVTDLNNGGTWFRLQNPVVIPDSGGSYTLSLAFNPDRLIKASASGASNASIQDTSAAVRGIYVPMLDLTPVLHQSSDSVRKESYALTGPAQFSLRLELYSVGSDAARTILGADLKTLYTPATTQNVMHPQKVSFLSTALDGSTTFEAWDHGALIQGFTRSASGGTVTLDCQAAFYGSDACGGAPTVTLTYAAPVVTMIE